MQIVVFEQNRGRVAAIAVEPDEFSAVLQPGLAARQGHRQMAVLHPIGLSVLVAAGRKREIRIEKGTAVRHDLRRAHLVEAGGPLHLPGLGDRIRAVERIIQAAPARIGGIERIAGIVDRHHELRTGNGRDLVINILGIDREIAGLRQQIADLFQEGLVGGGIVRLAFAVAVPGIELGLEHVTLGHQGGVAGGKLLQQRGEAVPEGGGVKTRTGQRFLFHEIIKHSRATCRPPTLVLGSDIKRLLILQASDAVSAGGDARGRLSSLCRTPRSDRRADYSAPVRRHGQTAPRPCRAPSR